MPASTVICKPHPSKYGLVGLSSGGWRPFCPSAGALPRPRASRKATMRNHHAQHPNTCGSGTFLPVELLQSGSPEHVPFLGPLLRGLNRIRNVPRVSDSSWESTGAKRQRTAALSPVVLLTMRSYYLVTSPRRYIGCHSFPTLTFAYWPFVLVIYIPFGHTRWPSTLADTTQRSPRVYGSLICCP